MDERKLGHEELKKYFKPIGNIPQIIGWILAALGVAGFFIGHFFMYIGVCMLGIGAAIILISRDSRASDTEVDDAIKRQIGDIEYWAANEVDVKEKLMTAFPRERFGEFEYDEAKSDPESFLLIRGRQDKRLRTNKYSETVILYAQEMLHVYKHTVHLTKEDEHVEKLNIKYTELDSAELIEEQGTYVPAGAKRGIPINTYHVIIKKNDGTEAISFPVPNGADIDKFVESTSRLIRNKKAKLTE